jgi:hypothetical protein
MEPGFVKLYYTLIHCNKFLLTPGGLKGSHHVLRTWKKEDEDEDDDGVLNILRTWL